MTEPSPTRPTAAVIGSGFGGLALAIRLQSAGFQTTVFEGRDKPGGRAYVWHDQGFTFDAGPTVVTDPACLEELFALSGRKVSDYVELMSVAPFYRLCWEDGDVFDYVNDQALLDAQIARKNPADVEGYKRFLNFSEQVFQEGYVKLGHVPFLDFRSMIAAAPQLVKLEAWRSVYAKVSGFVQDEHLRQALSFHTLLVGGSPFAASSIYALIHALERRGGVWFPRGGTHALVRAMVRLFEDLGGQIRLNAPVQAIETEGKTVRGVASAAGFEAFDTVASNADIVHTYDKLLKGHRRGRSEGARLKRARFSPSLFVVHFGLKALHPDIRHHTICFGERYKGLIDEIYGKPSLARDFSLYLHAPCASDPSMAPEGCSSYYALSPVPHLGTAPIDWAVEGPKYRDRILGYLEERYIPNLRRDLVTSRIFTPADFQGELNAWQGSAFSLEPVLTQSAWFRTHNRDDVIGNLYFVGAGTHPGAGIPGVVGSAKATAGLMIEDFAGALA
ncbi:phytoene desaturase [Caulobacter ginsengisoli]|uniref:Phytoene dehydrogenase n=1 Tax=Caulobacter ginsengisoli TaxID=400775 RepID=A0ABU0IP26_9CAUL|nr:phytoene desaturase [Caulobacter ginsengisoli]MDQ0463749.1 phytoene desaturase [Caulobacter ginsengisoli]